MGKVLNCKDVGFDCDGVCRGETVEKVLQMAAEHARTMHNIHQIPPEVVAKVRAAIRDE